MERGKVGENGWIRGRDRNGEGILCGVVGQGRRKREREEEWGREIVGRR